MEEIRRTVYVGNLPKDVDPKQLVDFFTAYIGEVRLSIFLSVCKLLLSVGDVHTYGRQ